MAAKLVLNAAITRAPSPIIAAVTWAPESPLFGCAANGLVMSMTGSLGVRTRQLERVVVQRRTVTVDVDGYDIDVKISDVRVKAEFDQVAVAAKALGLPTQEVAARAEALANDL